MAKSLKEIKMQKFMIDCLLKGNKVYKTPQFDFYGTNCVVRKISNCFLNENLIKTTPLLNLEEGYREVTKRKEYEVVKLVRSKVHPIGLFADNVEVVVNAKIFRVF